MPGATVAVALAAFAAAAMPGAAEAADRVDVTVTLTARFDGQGRFAALRERWTFDDAYSAKLLKALDTDGDGSLDAGEMGGLAGGPLAWIGQADYMTLITKDGSALQHGVVNDLTGGFAHNQFSASFTLTLLAPPVLSANRIAVADPAGVFNFSFDYPDVVADAPPTYCRVRRLPGSLGTAVAEVDCR